MSKLPKGWAAATLGRIVELKYGKSLPEKARIPGDVSVYGSNGVVGTHTSGVTAAPAIIVGRKGSIGEAHFSEATCFPIDTTYFVDEFECIEPRLAWHLFRFLPLREMNRASAIPGLNREDAYALPLALPPLPEQRRIVAKIDSLTGKSRRARDQLDHIPHLVEKYKQAVLDLAFSHVTARARLLDMVESERGIPYGIVQTGTPYEGGVPTVRCGDVKDFCVELNQLKRVDPNIEQGYQRTRLKGGEVLIAIRGSVGETCVVPAQLAGCNISREVAMIPTKPDISSHFVMYFLASSEAKRFILGNTKGVAQQGINLRDLKELPTPDCPFREQVAVVNRIETAFTWIDRLAANAASARRLIDHLDQSMLVKAFKGELVPQDPSDEPANILLERIRAECAAAPNAKRRRKKAA